MKMAYYIDLFSPETYHAFSRSNRDISGFRERHKSIADTLKPGDKLICYITKLSRWVGILEVMEPCFIDRTHIFLATADPFIVRFKVKPVVWL
jgi:predicted RNA-binding protein